MNQPEDSLTAAPSSTARPIPSESERPCLACGYDLQGLGEEPRCPECGLLNIPEGYRRQVQELVDSGKWFFSSFFGFARKRPPGWWWSLDRPGDVARAVKRALAYLLIGTLIVFFATAVGSAVGVERVQEYVMQSRVDSNGPPIEVFNIEGQTYIVGVCSIVDEIYEINRTESLPSSTYPVLRNSNRAFLRSPIQLEAIPLAAMLTLNLISLWLLPAAAGFWSQIRKGLPSYARPRRSIFAATLYEAHRVIYLAIIVFVGLVVDAYLRYSKPGFSLIAFSFSLVLVLFFWGSAGWIGSVRSDYTGHLIQSRWQAMRIVCLYAPLCLWLWLGMAIYFLLLRL